MSIVTLSSIFTSQMLYPELIFKTITTLSTNLIYSVQYLIKISQNDLELQKILIKSDILQDINIIKSFIEENKYKQQSSTILSCIHNINETLEVLEKNITSITQKIKEHDEKWFKYFRSYDITIEKEIIPFLIDKLKHRFDMLIKISTIIN
jgi:phenylalanyl-tRNA synthetase alpha subunit